MADSAQTVQTGFVRPRERHGIALAEIERFAFATTTAISAVLERKGGRTLVFET